jgi:hypothetical protein
MRWPPMLVRTLTQPALSRHQFLHSMAARSFQPFCCRPLRPKTSCRRLAPGSSGLPCIPSKSPGSFPDLPRIVALRPVCQAIPAICLSVLGLMVGVSGQFERPSRPFFSAAIFARDGGRKAGVCWPPLSFRPTARSGDQQQAFHNQRIRHEIAHTYPLYAGLGQ